MDIQQQRFELAIKEAFPNSPQYLNKNPDGTYRNTTTFGAWIGWKLAAKAQAVPEGFVLVPLDVVERCMSHICLAMCHQNNSNSENDVMQMDLEILESALEAQEPAND